VNHYDLPPLTDEGVDISFARVRAMLQGARYNEAFICREFGISRLSELSKGEPPRGTDAFLMLLFMLGRSVPVEVLQGAFEFGGVFRSMLEIGMLHIEGERGYVPVLFYEMDGVYIASDRIHNVDGSRRDIPADFVYLCFTENTDSFLRLLPAEPKGNFLEIGTGAGIAALKAAKTATNVWATDLSARAVLFADWNRRMNGIQNLTVLPGDVYEPLPGKRFKTIVCHAPHDPGFRSDRTFANGGVDGEQVTLRLIAGLPEHLEENGEAILLTMGTDRIGRPYEERIRESLGSHAEEFDLVLIPLRERTSVEQQEWSRTNPDAQEGDAEGFAALDRQYAIERYVYSAVYLKRHGEARMGRTVRRAPMAQPTYADFIAALSGAAGLAYSVN
jgi:SAM-dependent methyltransferase